MSAEMDALAVVNQLRDLAADPLNRRAIVEDQGCLPGLILFLDHPNPQVVYSALLVRHFKIHCFMVMFHKWRGIFILTGMNVSLISFDWCTTMGSKICQRGWKCFGDAPEGRGREN